MKRYQNLILFHRLSLRRISEMYRQISAVAEFPASPQSSRNSRHYFSSTKSAALISVRFNLSAESFTKLNNGHRLKSYHSMIEEELKCPMARRDYSLRQDVAMANCTITRLCEEGKISEARQLFEEMPERDVISWTALISGYMKHGLVEEARDLFDRVDAEKSDVTWTALISGYLKAHRVAEAEKLFDEMPDKNVVACNTMIEGYVKNGRIELAVKVFERMRERNILSWNTLISGLISCGRIEQARGIFDRMPVKDVISWNMLISGLSRNGKIDEAKLLFNKMPDRSVVSWNTMITGLIQNGEMGKAKKLFEEMPGKNVVSWTAIISGYTQHGENEEALKTFYTMNRSRRVKPNEATFASILGACSNLSALVEGTQIHQLISKTIYQESKFVISALINMYSKCGVLEMARKVFDHASSSCKDLVCWNSMISAYSHHGCGREAISIFDEMKSTRLKPDDVTYLGLLSACSHAGLVQEGLSYFEMLVRDKSVRVREEHYTCIIGLYGRAGRLEDAFELIKKLPTKASVYSWCTLLLGCKIHGNDDIGKEVAKRLLEIEGGEAGFYALVSNLYAARGKSKEAELLQLRMKDEGLKKQPGCSWIEVGNKFHVFVVGDRSREEHEGVRSLIFDLHEEMKKISDGTCYRFKIDLS